MSNQLQLMLQGWGQLIRETFAPLGDTFERLFDRAQNTTHASYELGETLLRRREFAEAKLRFKYVLWKDPKHYKAWRGMARCMFALDETAEAKHALAEALRLNPNDELAHFIKATAMNGELAEGYIPKGLPEQVLEREYSGNVASWQRIELLSKSYCGHLSMGACLESLLPEGYDKPAILELGCGTGLCGRYLKPNAHHLTGLDQSVDMLKFAKSANREDSLEIYDDFIKADLHDYLLNLRQAKYGVIIAANVVTHLGDLERFAQGIYKGLSVGGYVLFSIYEKAEGDGYDFMPQTRRFRHSLAYIRTVMKQAGLQPLNATQVPLYLDEEAPKSMMVIVRKDA